LQYKRILSEAAFIIVGLCATVDIAHADIVMQRAEDTREGLQLEDGATVDIAQTDIVMQRAEDTHEGLQLEDGVESRSALLPADTLLRILHK